MKELIGYRAWVCHGHYWMVKNILARVLLQSQKTSRGNNPPPSPSPAPTLHSSSFASPSLVSKLMENQETRHATNPPLDKKNIDIASMSNRKRKHVERSNPLDLSIFRKN